jgi:carbonic anhydrase/acetyltransferase-like protein (isoleucine patch superfamily)
VREAIGREQVAGTFVGDEASIGAFVALDDVHISSRATLDGWVAHLTKPLPVGLGTVVGRNATLGADHILGTDTTISRAVTAGARLTTGAGATVGYAAVLGTDVTVDANGTVGSLVELGNYTHVGPAAVVARGCTVADSASSGAASTILGVVGPEVTIGSNVLVEGTARVRKHATLLDGAQVLDGARVGRGAIVEAGATVSGVVRANATVCEGATLGATDLVGSGDTWPPTGCTLEIVDNAGVREWSNGTYAATCNDYINPGTGHSYAGATGDGLYRIDPSGSDAFIAHCDMTTDSGGWTIAFAATGANNEQAMVSNTAVSGNPLAFQAYNTTRQRKVDLSALATESIFVRNNTAWFKINSALFDGTLLGGNTHAHYLVTVTAKNGAQDTSAVAGWSTTGSTHGGDYGVRNTTSFDHHGGNYYHLQSSCVGHYLYNYSSAEADSDAGYDVNIGLGDWAATSACHAPEGGSLAFYTGMR